VGPSLLVLFDSSFLTEEIPISRAKTMPMIKKKEGQTNHSTGQTQRLSPLWKFFECLFLKGLREG